ncbi:CLOCK-interacting pacemaker [Betta splendens]|uniref:CLOCK-interacting pacemaker n=1 Tax=Betta splendens TaxID=158456 RepID=A0A6P7PAR1_BETSP|nr:CLOCK-interacting pacemaker [Betta splendens]XP_029027339.1 CLOCK-interacting pacemaker [Betta splendens]XP_055370020.1 CLOCK-interacting pacemaker [Betta splendens]
MSKEQPCSCEQSPGATSVKSAKEKDPCAALLAKDDSKADADDSSARGSNCSSEKDSGYSDGSDWQQTDVEDQRTNRSQSRGGERAEPSQSSQNQRPGLGSAGNPSFMSAGHELSPIYIIKNMADVIQKRGQLIWTNASRDTSSSSAPHMILLPQPSLLPSTVQLHKPLSFNAASGRKIKGPRPPVRNAYPRIAPHPSKKPPEASLSKRVSGKLSDPPEPRSSADQHLFKQPSVSVSASVQPCSSSPKDTRSPSSSTTSSSRQTSQSASSPHGASSILATRRLHKSATTSTRHRRFLNTVEILRQSGLLDITLHTKKLLRQSNATERDIAQLRQHTGLLCQAAGSHSPGGITRWEQLYRTMAESGNYPDLDINTHPDSATQPETISMAKTNRSGAGSSDAASAHLSTSIAQPNQNCPVPQQPRQRQGREFDASNKFSEKVTFMPPDSSTD